uniref:Uncharacterized protein n=1 Tax=Cacopsylla melanoneura TaxID=428564 RepID=A0A8D8TZL4_9HEMI
MSLIIPALLFLLLDMSLIMCFTSFCFIPDLCCFSLLFYSYFLKMLPMVFIIPSLKGLNRRFQHRYGCDLFIMEKTMTFITQDSFHPVYMYQAIHRYLNYTSDT